MPHRVIQRVAHSWLGGYCARMGMVFAGFGLLLLAVLAFSGGGLLPAVGLTATGLVLSVTAALRHARAMDD